MGFDVKQLFAEICGEDVFFAFAGNITSGQINSILEEIEERFVSLDTTNTKIRKKVYNIMVESLQNLFHHSDEIPEELVESLGPRYGMIVIKRKDDDFRITAGNFVSTLNQKNLTEKIEKINSLTADELKEMYKYILNFQKMSPKGGGGLGLIDIARKSENKLGFKFYPFNADYSFYTLDIFISV
jgi:hypothetical protein